MSNVITIPSCCCQVHVHPFGIKQQPFQRVDTPVKFSVQSSLLWKYQFIPRLEQHLRLCELAQKEFPWKQIAVQKYILRPATKGLDGFVDGAWSSSECLNALHLACSELSQQMT